MAFATVYTRLWPGASIPYEIDADHFPVGSSARAEIEKAIAEWNEHTVVRLVPRSDEVDYLVFEDQNDKCFSHVGMVSGRQPVSCNLEGGGFRAASLMHEIGHAVGFQHEHQRPDRDRFVSVGGSPRWGHPRWGQAYTIPPLGSGLHYTL